MKLRIKGDSLRLRVTRSELKRLLEGREVSETTHFGPGPQHHLRYALASVPHADAVKVHYHDRAITVLISDSQMREWSPEDQIGIYAKIDWAADATLEVAIEKDFACLDRNDEENADTFAHPLAGQSC